MDKMKELNAEVEMVNTGEGKPAIHFKQFIKAFGRLGAVIRISPKANVTLNKAGFTARYMVDTISVTIGIGNDHTAELIMTEEAWKALKEGEKVSVMTTNEFKKKYK